MLPLRTWILSTVESLGTAGPLAMVVRADRAGLDLAALFPTMKDLVDEGLLDVCPTKNGSQGWRLPSVTPHPTPLTPHPSPH